MVGDFLWARYPCRVLREARLLRGEVPLELPKERAPSRWQEARFRNVRTFAGVPHLQENAPNQDPAVGLCLGS